METVRSDSRIRPGRFAVGTGPSERKYNRPRFRSELPRIFCILTGKMSIIGPRPALWNQDDLIAERDK